MRREGSAMQGLGVVTLKEMDEFGAIRSLNIGTWKKCREELDRIGGPPDRPAANGTAGSPDR